MLNDSDQVDVLLCLHHYLCVHVNKSKSFCACVVVMYIEDMYVLFPQESQFTNTLYGLNLETLMWTEYPDKVCTGTHTATVTLVITLVGCTCS